MPTIVCLPARSLVFVVLVVSLAAGRVEGEEAKSSQQAKIKFSAAAELQNEGLFDLAAVEWREFLEQYKNDPLATKARHYLGVCLLQEKQYAAAATELAALAASAPKFEMLDETLLNLGMAHYSVAVASKKRSDFAAAESAYGRLIEQFGDSKWVPNALYYRGECLFAMEQLEAAAAAYTRLLETHPKHERTAETLYALGVAQLGLKQAVAAERTFDSFLKAFPDHDLVPRITLHKADALFDQAKYEAAHRLYTTAAAVKQFDKADDATMRAADCLTSLKRYGEAAALFASVPDRFPKSLQIPAATLAAGNRYYFADDQKQAIKWLQKVKGKDTIEAAHWLARAYLALDQPAEALAAIDSVLSKAAKSSFHVELLLDRADAIYEIPDRRNESIALYRQIADQHPDHDKAAPARYYAAWSASNVGQHKMALQQANKFLQDHADHELVAAARSIAADSQLNTGDFQSAEREYRELIKTYPKHDDTLRWHRLLGWSLYRQKRHADAVALLEPIIEQFQSANARAEVLFVLGSSQFALKSFKQAAARLEAAYQVAPQGTQADESLLLLSRARRQLDDFAAARTTVRKLIKEFPQSELNDRAHYQLGNYCYAEGDYTTATAAYRTVTKQWPASSVAAAAKYWLGWCDMNRDQPAEAVKVFSDLIQNHPDDDFFGPALYARAQARRLAGQFNEAIKDVDAFVKTEPKLADKSGALYERGLCELELKQSATAVATFTSILKTDPQYSGADQVKYQLGWSLMEAGQSAKAGRMFATLAADHPDSVHAAESLYHVGEDHYRNRAYRKAASAYDASQQKAAEAGQTDIIEMAAHKLAWSYYHQDDFQRALDGYEYQIKAFGKGALLADALFMKAECLFKLGQFAKASAAYKESRSNPPASKDFQALGLLQAARAAAQQKLWDESLGLLEQARQQFPDSTYRAEMLYESGYARKNKGELDEALRLFAQVVELTQMEVGVRARLMMGEIKFENGQHREAIRDYFKVFRGYPGAPESYNPLKAEATYEAGRCFEALKSVEQAKKYYQELLEKYPKSQVAGFAKQRMAALK